MTNPQFSDEMGSFLRLFDDAKSGSRQALGCLLEALRPYLTNVATNEVDSDIGAKESPSDLVQKSMMEATRDFPAFQGATEAEFRVWLKSILLNNVRDLFGMYLTEKRRLDREVQRVVANAPGEALTPADETPSQTAVKNEQANRLETALLKLSAEQREVIRLRHEDKMSFAQIGAVLGISDMAAQKRWARAVEELRVLMGE